MTAAAPLPPECRAEFMQAVTDALVGAEPGPGILYRTIQRQYLSGERPRYPHQKRRTPSAANSGPIRDTGPETEA
jgi:hypothetical protein